MAIAAWAEQQQLELNLRARRLARSKVATSLEISNTMSFVYAFPKGFSRFLIEYQINFHNPPKYLR